MAQRRALQLSRRGSAHMQRNLGVPVWPRTSFSDIRGPSEVLRSLMWRYISRRSIITHPHKILQKVTSGIFIPQNPRTLPCDTACANTRSRSHTSGSHTWNKIRGWRLYPSRDHHMGRRCSYDGPAESLYFDVAK